MKPSKHNIISQVPQSQECFVVNPLYGKADFLSAAEATEIEGGIQRPEMIARHYVVNEAVERSKQHEAYLDFIDQRCQEEIQLFFVPTYQCNFDCGYCYQESYADQECELATPAVVAAFFNYMDATFTRTAKYVTLFGGEPLLASNKHKQIVTLFVNETARRNVDLSVVTNGYWLQEYIDILSKTAVREIQVTLDGTEQIHNARRPLKNGGATFDRIEAGIDAALAAGMPINLRVVLDKENMPQLPALAQFAIDKNWTSNPLFKTQLGRNYELHQCSANSSALYSRLEMYLDLANVIKAHPHVLIFHEPSFCGIKQLLKLGQLPPPVFDACPGCTAEWAFDATGHIYSCTATVGKTGESLGTFYPDVALNQTKIDAWQNRDVSTIEQCRDCAVQLICGGGCAAVAKKQTGQLLSPDCRPVKALLELGMKTYYRHKWDTPK